MLLRARLFNCVSNLAPKQKMIVFLGMDAALGVLALLLTMDLPPTSGNFATCALLLAVAGLGAVSSAICGLPRIKLKAYGRHALRATAKFGAMVACGTATFLHFLALPFDPVSVAKFGTFMVLGCIIGRYALLSALLWILRYGQIRRRVLIYGAGDTGQQMAAALRYHPHILPVAFLDDDIDIQAITVGGLPVLSPSRLHLMVRELAADRVLLAMPSMSPAKLLQIKRRFGALGLDVHSLPSFAQLAGTETVAAVHTAANPSQFLGRLPLAPEGLSVDQSYMGRVVLISGAGGSVGSELCRQLIGHKPKALVLFERSEIALYAIDLDLRSIAAAANVQIIPVLGCVTDAQLARRTMKDTRTDIVFHAAAYKHLPLVESNPIAGLTNNVLGTRIFAEAAIHAGVARFVLISTDKAVQPISVMGATKRLAELVVHDLAKRTKDTWFSTVRFGNVLGSSGSVLPLFRQQIAAGGPITLTDEDATRYFMTLAEAARLVLVAGTFVQTGHSGDIYVLDMGHPVRIRELAESMIKAEGMSVKSPSNTAGDIEIVVTGLRPGEKLHEALLISDKVIQTSHAKILRAPERGLSEFTVASAINAVRAVVRSGDHEAAVEVLGNWVEGFPQRTNGSLVSTENNGLRESTKPALVSIAL